jgi:hypothetical protein
MTTLEKLRARAHSGQAVSLLRTRKGAKYCATVTRGRIHFVRGADDRFAFAPDGEGAAIGFSVEDVLAISRTGDRLTLRP